MTDRRRPAHPPTIERINAPIIVFVTVCTAHRRPILAMPSAVAILRRAWVVADAWAVGRYVVMPDHLHFFCAPRQGASLSSWMHFWKSLTARHWPGGVARPLWQRDFWDTQLRSATSYQEKWEYVRWNPVRHGFACHPDAWPYQGEMTSIEWL